MAYMNSLIDGGRLAFAVGITLAVTNGLWRRFSPSGASLTTAINTRLGVNGGGMS